MWTRAIRFSLVFLVLCGLLYPLATTGLAQALFPRQAAGSLIRGADGTVVGSELIGQSFTDPQFFHGRVSPSNYDGTASGGSAYGPTDEVLLKRVKADVAEWQRTNPGQPIPPDLVTSSGSGLDPHITPDTALAEVPRVSKATGVAEEKLRTLVAQQTEGRSLGIFGEPRVNVLKLNLALRQLPTR